MSDMSLLEACVRRAGGGLSDMPRGMKVCTFVCQWAVFVSENGRDPRNVEEWAAWWKVSSAYGWRRLRMFRELFPDFDTPSEIAAQLLERSPAPFRGSEAQFLPVAIAPAA